MYLQAYGIHTYRLHVHVPVPTRPSGMARTAPWDLGAGANSASPVPKTEVR